MQYNRIRAVTSTAILALAIAGFTIATSRAADVGRSSPPDNNSYSRAVVSEDFDPLNTAGKSLGGEKAVQFDVFVADTVVNNTDPSLKNTDTFNDGEVSIAISPQHPNEIVITAFSGSWVSERPFGGQETAAIPGRKRLRLIRLQAWAGCRAVPAIRL